jgi:hypothetical protein
VRCSPTYVPIAARPTPLDPPTCVGSCCHIKNVVRSSNMLWGRYEPCRPGIHCEGVAFRELHFTPIRSRHDGHVEAQRAEFATQLATSLPPSLRHLHDKRSERSRRCPSTEPNCSSPASYAAPPAHEPASREFGFCFSQPLADHHAFRENKQVKQYRVMKYFTRRLLGLDLTFILLHRPGSASQKVATRSMGMLLKVVVAAVRPPCGNCDLQRS